LHFLGAALFILFKIGVKQTSINTAAVEQGWLFANECHQYFINDLYIFCLKNWATK
jgi:hypothetical protein